MCSPLCLCGRDEQPSPTDDFMSLLHPKLSSGKISDPVPTGSEVASFCTPKWTGFCTQLYFWKELFVSICRCRFPWFAVCSSKDALCAGFYKKVCLTCAKWDFFKNFLLFKIFSSCESKNALLRMALCKASVRNWCMGRG